MRVRTLLTGLGVCLTTLLHAQNNDLSVLGAAAGTGKTSSMSVDYTLGEYAVESVYASTSFYTQGFNQPYLVMKSYAHNNVTALDSSYTVSVAPNPVLTLLNLTIREAVHPEVMLTVMDVRGKLLLQQKLPANAPYTQMNFTSLLPGAYFLTIRETATTHVVKSLQIIKL